MTNISRSNFLKRACRLGYIGPLASYPIVTDLITTIIKARAEGIKAGDGPSAPLELIVRRVDRGSEFHEQVVLRVGHTEPLDEKVIEQRINEALGRLVSKDDVEES